MPVDMMMANNFIGNIQNHHQGIPQIRHPPMVHPSFMGIPPNHNPSMGIPPYHGSYGVPQAVAHHGGHPGLPGDVHPHSHMGPTS